MTSLLSPVEQIPGLGPPLARRLHAAGLTSLGKLVAHLPFRHERHEAEAPIAQIAPGSIVSARGEITATRLAGGYGKKRRFEAVLHDGQARLDLVWFNQPYLREKIQPGMRLRVQGKAQKYGGGLQLTNPKYETLRDEGDEPAPADARLRPVYPASEKIRSDEIERAMVAALPVALPLIEDHLPEEFRRSKRLPALAEAYRMLHAPETEAEAAAGRRRLAYDELLLLQLGVHMKRAHLRSALKAPALKWSEAIDTRIRRRLPFALTGAQDRVIEEIAGDLSRSAPTNRQNQGDVGSGKTGVALYAMLMAVASKRQGALMAPTELLAEQHFASLSRLLEGSDVRMALLTGATATADRDSILRALEAGAIDILVGTHALITQRVRFASLAVAVIDEQHRFGVAQRAQLREKGTGDGAVTPHVLVMTATPIPRTMAIALFGDLDISTIDELPPGRTPIRSRLVPPAMWAEVYGYVRKRLDDGEQAYIVAPTIDSGEGTARNVRTLMRALEEGELAGKKLAAMHGRLKRDTRERIMERFRLGRIDALVATTVIEVGVDVPNATVMVVEHAERFGLAQLHQLRGRVGRGEKASLCVFIGEPATAEAEQRLKTIADTTDGFKLAEADFNIRGPGEMFGTRQSGLPPFKVADLMRDIKLLDMARRDAAAWIERSPELAAPEEALLRRRLMKAYGEEFGLADVG
ncbi:MAG: ATP-dependent DNA helicase RecG [Phycisphaerales bacterium JB039]